LLLFSQAWIRSLFYFEQHGVFEHPKAVTAVKQHYNVPNTQFSGRHENSTVVVNVDFAPPTPDNQDLGGTAYESFLRPMRVPGDLVPSRMHDVADLQGHVGWSDEFCCCRK
jgi:hypothetical protein